MVDSGKLEKTTDVNLQTEKFAKDTLKSLQLSHTEFSALDRKKSVTILMQFVPNEKYCNSFLSTVRMKKIFFLHFQLSLFRCIQ